MDADNRANEMLNRPPETAKGAGGTGFDISIVLCGQAGQGIQTVEKLLMRILKSTGYHVFSTQEFMSRVRGGMNSTQIRVSENPVHAPINRMNVLVPLDKGGISHVSCRITPETIIVGEAEVCQSEIQEGFKLYDIPFARLAAEAGDKLYANVVAVGALLCLLGLDLERCLELLKTLLAGKEASVIEGNVSAAGKGYAAMTPLSPCKLLADFKINPEVGTHLQLNGAEAIGLGALAGGCNFVSSYPMSPSTAVLSFLAQKGDVFGIIVEQAEDEIAAMNMAIGAWYAGARAMVTTSGGGFALMTEGLSLAGMIESPMVIHLAQRPGPATGLPTRTEQGDLEFALYSGHGEFPRIIFAPGTVEEGVYLTQRAFNIADKYQMPVFILTDQYFIDSKYNTPSFNVDGLKVEKCIVRTSKDYRRYAFTPDGISPRGIPGFGEGLVCVDSDEHDEDGHITENCVMRSRMVEKRLRKADAFKAEAIAPKLYGSDDFKVLVLCWGSALYVTCEALALLEAQDAAVLHFSQVYPLDRTMITQLVQRAKKTILVENNATGQFGRILKNYASVEVSEMILKYNGLSFASDELAALLGPMLKEAP